MKKILVNRLYQYIGEDTKNLRKGQLVVVTDNDGGNFVKVSHTNEAVRVSNLILRIDAPHMITCHRNGKVAPSNWTMGELAVLRASALSSMRGKEIDVLNPTELLDLLAWGG